MVALIVVLGVYGALGVDTTSGSGIAILGGVIGVILALGAWTLGPLRHRAPTVTLGLRLPTARGFHLLILPCLVLLASLLFTGVYYGVISALGWDTAESPLEEIDLEGPASYVGLAIVVVLWGPLSEEIFFRGFIFSGLIGRFGVTGAAVAASLLFALFHVDPRVMVPIFVTGMLLAWLYHKTGSIWSPFVTHGMQNAVAFSFSVGS